MGPEPLRSPGTYLVRLAWQSTTLLALAAVAGVTAPGSFGIVLAVLSSAMFVLGLVFLLLALLGGLRRSRVEEITVTGLFLLHDTAPRAIRRLFLWCLMIQLSLAFVAAGLRPYTQIAFVILAPMFVFGSAALWSAQYGIFSGRGCDPA
ncbi:MAG: hypothetical protein CL460_00635 [Acidimicrobiaceae bacterium]|nr:hypothetical protein [Acidimicrobiaceae bacterium]